MALRNILQEPDDRLRKKSRPVKEITPHLSQLIDDMIETLAFADGAGLAAPQVGVLRRIVIVDAGEGPIVMVNPVITSKDGSQTGQEGCLSCEGRWGIVTRPEKVTAEYMDRDGNMQTIEGEKLLARAICHEVDHLEGQLFIDIMERELEPEELEDDEEETDGEVSDEE